jgi:hypothetical protein
MKACVCTTGNPCDYHAATCITCPNGKCVGHPSGIRNNKNFPITQEERDFVNEFQRMAKEGYTTDEWLNLINLGVNAGMNILEIQSPAQIESGYPLSRMIIVKKVRK